MPEPNPDWLRARWHPLQLRLRRVDRYRVQYAGEMGLDDPAAALLVEQTVPMNRQGTAEEIAPSVAFLASDDAASITGRPLVIDGGQMAL